MTMWRGKDFPVVVGQPVVPTAAETAEMFHHVLMNMRDMLPGEYEAKQRRVTEVMERLQKDDGDDE